MPQRRCTRGVVRFGTWVVGVGGLLFVGCQGQSEARDFTPSAAVYKDRMLAQHEERAADDGRGNSARPVPWQADLPAKAALVTQPGATAAPPAG